MGYTPHRRPWRFGHFLQLALTFVHQHFLQGTSVYLRFVPFFQCFRRRCSAVKNWVGDMGPWCCRQAHWNTSSETIGERTVCNNVCNVQGTLTCPTPPQPLPHIVAVAEHQQRLQRTRNVNMAPPQPSPCPTSWQVRNINNVCNLQGTLTCSTPPHPQTLVDVVSTSFQNPGKYWEMVKGTRPSMRRVPTTWAILNSYVANYQRH